MATDLEKKLTENRIILVNGYIDTDAASYIVFQLLQLSALSDTEPIQLFIGSYGGNYLDMLAIYDTICSIPNPVTGVGMGAVSNYAALLLAGCKKGSRFALRHCAFNIEQPYGTLHAGTNQQTEIAIASREVSLEREVMEQLFSLHTGQEPDRIHYLLPSRRWNTDLSTALSTDICRQKMHMYLIFCDKLRRKGKWTIRELSF